MTDEPRQRTDDEVLAVFQNAKSIPPSSRAVGFEVIAVNQAEGTLTVSFQAPAEWTNPRGALQGGFITAMLDEAMTAAGIAAAGFTKSMPTLELKVSFLRPAMPGRLVGIGRARRIGKSVAFLEGELYDASEKLVAKASCTAAPQPLPPRK